MDLGPRLAAILELLERGALSPAAVEVLEAAVGSPAVRRAIRNDCILRLAGLVGGPAEAYRLVSAEAWRWTLWARRGVPARASEAERLAYEAWSAGPPVSRRQVERILRHRGGAQCRDASPRLAVMPTQRTA